MILSYFSVLYTISVSRYTDIDTITASANSNSNPPQSTFENPFDVGLSQSFHDFFKDFRVQ